MNHSTRRCNYDVRYRCKLLRLFHHVNAAHYNRNSQIQIIPCKHLKLFHDLECQLSCWSQYKTENSVWIIGKLL